MRKFAGSIALSLLLAGFSHAQTEKIKPTETPKQAPKITLTSPDGKKTYDLEKLVEKGPC